MILLDTCALLWLAHDRTRISDETLRRIDETPVVTISAITSFEVGIKYRAGKLKLPLPPSQWMAGISEHHEIAAIDLTCEFVIGFMTVAPDNNGVPGDIGTVGFAQVGSRGAVRDRTGHTPAGRFRASTPSRTSSLYSEG